MGAQRIVRGACRPTAFAAGGVALHFSGADRLMEFLISSFYEFC